MVWSVSAFFRTATPCSHSVVVSLLRASGAASRSAFLTAPQVAYSRTARLSLPRLRSSNSPGREMRLTFLEPAIALREFAFELMRDPEPADTQNRSVQHCFCSRVSGKRFYRATSRVCSVARRQCLDQFARMVADFRLCQRSPRVALSIVPQITDDTISNGSYATPALDLRVGASRQCYASWSRHPRETPDRACQWRFSTTAKLGGGL